MLQGAVKGRIMKTPSASVKPIKLKKVAISNVPHAVVQALQREAEREALSISDIGRRIWMQHYGLLKG